MPVNIELTPPAKCYLRPTINSCDGMRSNTSSETIANRYPGRGEECITKDPVEHIVSLEDIPLSEPVTPPTTSTEEQEPPKKKKWFYRHVFRNVMLLLFLFSIIALLGWVTLDAKLPSIREAYKNRHGHGHNSTSGANGTNATNTTLTRRDIPVVLPLWDNLGVRDESSPVGAEEKLECSMRKRNQCYTGHKCYRGKCVTWCRDNSNCWSGHTCLRQERGTSWRMCSLDPDVQVPCQQNYSACKENGDCCTGSCQQRGDDMICVPPERFEREDRKPNKPPVKMDGYEVRRGGVPVVWRG